MDGSPGRATPTESLYEITMEFVNLYVRQRAAKRGGPYNLWDSFPGIRWAAVGGGPYSVVG